MIVGLALVLRNVTLFGPWIDSSWYVDCAVSVVRDAWAELSASSVTLYAAAASGMTEVTP